MNACDDLAGIHQPDILPGENILQANADRWMGVFRPRPEDGYSPVVRDDDTGLPTEGVKVEEKKQKF